MTWDKDLGVQGYLGCGYIMLYAILGPLGIPWNSPLLGYPNVSNPTNPY